MELCCVAVSVIRIGGFSQEIVELLSQAFHGSVNISETHALAGDRGKLLLHRVDELCGQSAVIGHGRVTLAHISALTVALAAVLHGPHSYRSAKLLQRSA